MENGKGGRKEGMRVLIKNPSLLQLKDQVRMKQRMNEREEKLKRKRILDEEIR